MAQFGKNSKLHYSTIHPDLQAVLDEAIKHFDFSIIWGHRNEQQQNKAFIGGFSTKRWPNSRHNSLPATAFDVVPYPGAFKASDKEFYLMATHIYQAASKFNIPIVWGGHWTRPRDLAHFQLYRIRA